MAGDSYKGPIEGVHSPYYYSHQTVNGISIADVHRFALYELIWNRNNNSSITEDGEKILQSGPRTYVVKDITVERYWNILPFSERFLNEYTHALMLGYDEHVKFEYDYHSRLYHYTTNYRVGGENVEDQIDTMIKKLIKQQNTRRAVAITWMPDVDNYYKDCPCLQYIQFVVANNALHMNVLFRSNDMLSAFGNNAYALTTLQRYVCDYVSRSINKKLDYGYYNHTAICPHIYYTRDAAEYQTVIDYFHQRGMI